MGEQFLRWYDRASHGAGWRYPCESRVSGWYPADEQGEIEQLVLSIRDTRGSGWIPLSDSILVSMTEGTLLQFCQTTAYTCRSLRLGTAPAIGGALRPICQNSTPTPATLP
jgi:hypothetical protein